MIKILIFVAVCIFAFAAGGIFATYLLAGVFNLLGIIFMIETIAPLKRFVTKYRNAFDVLLFGFGIYASIAMGVTIGVSFIIAGLGYTMMYKPYLAGEFTDTNLQNDSTPNKIPGRNRRRRYRHL